LSFIEKISHVLLLAVISGVSDYHFGDNVAFVARH
jgi:hypothetical protein